MADLNARALGGKSATLEDCLRLWTYLKSEYLPNLEIRVSLGTDAHIRAKMVVEVYDFTSQAPHGQDYESIWSSREYFNPISMISYMQLFDLLIVAHNNVEAFQADGVAKHTTRWVE